MNSCMTITTIGPHRLILGNAYTVLPTLGWFDALCMDLPICSTTAAAGPTGPRAAPATRSWPRLDQGFDPAIIDAAQCGAVVVFCHNDRLAT
jgi:hypothetical protein